MYLVASTDEKFFLEEPCSKASHAIVQWLQEKLLRDVAPSPSPPLHFTTPPSPPLHFTTPPLHHPSTSPPLHFTTPPLHHPSTSPPLPFTTPPLMSVAAPLLPIIFRILFSCRLLIKTFVKDCLLLLCYLKRML